MRAFSFLFAAALVILFAACSADAVSFSSETCNDQKCCGRSCCTKEAGWCQHPQCTHDESCGSPELYSCVDGMCEPHFRACSSTVCCTPGTACVSGVGRDWVCAPLCDKSHACPGGYECNASGACQPSAETCGSSGCGAGSLCRFGRCLPTCTTSQDCAAGTQCTGGACVVNWSSQCP